MDIKVPITLNVFLPIITLVLGILAMLIFRLYRPRFSYHWLAAAASTLLTWPLILILHRRIPAEVPLSRWQPDQFFTSSPALLFDTVSWSFASALSVLVLAVILTAVARTAGAAWLTWSGCLLLAALGILSVMSGNPLTLALTLAALDITEITILLHLMRTDVDRQQIAFGFSTRLLALFLLIWTVLLADRSGTSLSFAAIPAEFTPFLLLAAGLQLAVFPFHLPITSRATLRRGLGTQIRLVSAAPGLMLMVRAAEAPTPPSVAPYLLGLAALLALVCAVIWAAASDEIEGRPFWILGVGSLTLAAAVLGQPQASLAWGLALLLPGGMVFLLSARHPRLRLLPMLGILGVSCLPFTPTWQAARLYSPPFQPVLAVFLLAQALLLFGYARHTLRPGPSLPGIERWVWLIYPAGITLPIFGQWVTSWWGDPPIPSASLPWTGAWTALAAALLAALLVFWLRGRPELTQTLQSHVRHIAFPRWLSPTLLTVYRLFRRLAAVVSLVLEGEGGILWTLLLLLLLLTYLMQRPA